MPDAIVMRQPMGSVIVRFPSQNVVMGAASRDPIVMAAQPKTVVVTVGHQGPPGIQGPIGPSGGQALERIAGQTISALRVVYEDENGAVYPLDATDEDHVFSMIGVTLTAADTGKPVTVQHTGFIREDSWSWLPGQRLFLGAAGSLSATPPNNGFDVLIGTALSPQRIALHIQDPIDIGE